MSPDLECQPSLIKLADRQAPFSSRHCESPVVAPVIGVPLVEVKPPKFQQWDPEVLEDCELEPPWLHDGLLHVPQVESGIGHICRPWLLLHGSAHRQGLFSRPLALSISWEEAPGDRRGIGGVDNDGRSIHLRKEQVTTSS